MTASIAMRVKALLRRGLLHLQSRNQQHQASAQQSKTLKEIDGELCQGRLTEDSRGLTCGHRRRRCCRLALTAGLALLCRGAEEKFGGWKSAQMLFSNQPQRQSLIGRCAGCAHLTAFAWLG